MFKAGLVSIVIPTYNRAYCLPATLESVFAQTYQNFEIIIVDDGSTDGTEEMIQARYSNEPRLHYFRQKNQGVSVARNLAIDHSKGEFIALLDSDDLWMPWKLEAQLAAFKRFPEAVMVHSEMEAIDPDGRVFDKQFLRAIYAGYGQFPISEIYSDSCSFDELGVAAPAEVQSAKVWCGDIYSHSLISNMIHTSAVLVKRAPDGSVERYTPTLRVEETFDFHLRITHRGPVVFIDASTIRYQRGRADHIWTLDISYPPKKLYELNRLYLETVEPRVAALGKRLRVSKKALGGAVSKAHGWAAVTAAGIGEYRAMFRHAFESLRHQPWQPRLLLRMVYYMMPRRGLN